MSSQDLTDLLLQLKNSSLTKKELSDFFRSLTPEQKEEFDKLLMTVTAAWAPLPGPQTLAYESEADVLLYGGAAGGGKTDLLLGLALLYRRAILFRRVYPNLKAIIDRSRMLYARPGTDPAKFRESHPHLWRFSDGRQIHLGSIQHEKNVFDHQGQPYDFYGWDEITEFSEFMLRYVTTWLRSLDFSRKYRRKERIVCTCNPPTTPEGLWIETFWAPWLDEQHPRPAIPGELRYFTTLSGKDTEVDGPDPFNYKGEIIIPKSRTFIPASIDDNPYLVDSGYRSQLQQLPEPLRSKMLFGDFKAGVEDDVNQLIPTLWVKLAQQRGRERPAPKGDPDQLGVDVARGGRDRTVLTPRWGTYFGEQKQRPGKFTADGDAAALFVLQNSGVMTSVHIDVIGVGSSAYDSTKKVRRTIPMNASQGTEPTDTDRSGLLHFKNQRSLWYWSLREALDPNPEHNPDPISLPDSRELLADLCAPRVRISGGIIQVESKDDIIDRLGRSPDCGDSCVYAHSRGKLMAGQGLIDHFASEYKKFQKEEEEFRKRYGQHELVDDHH